MNFFCFFCLYVMLFNKSVIFCYLALYGEFYNVLQYGYVADDNGVFLLYRCSDSIAACGVRL